MSKKLTEEFLFTQLGTVLDQLDEQIEEVEKTAEGLGCSPYQVQDMHGAFLMIPLLVAKAHVLTAITQLEKET